MRLLKDDAPAGFLHLRLDALDDLWTLRTIVQTGDLVTADTFRTAEASGDKIRSEKMEKRPVRLTVRADSVEWHDFDDHLRVLGPITGGAMDMGRHHTLILRPDGGDVQVQKKGPVPTWHLRLVKDAVAHSARPHVLVLAIDDSEAQFAVLASYGIQFLGSLPSGGLGKRFGSSDAAKQQFYGEVLKSLKALRKEGVPLVVVGPGWWREEFLALANEKEPALVKGAATDGTAHGGRLGIHEALRRGTVEQVARDHRVDADQRLLDQVLERIGKDDGTVTYGPADVAAAIAAGAVDDLLASDTVVRSGKHDALIRDAESARARLHVLSTGHEAGRRLDQIGGVAALLRFPLKA